MGDTAKCKWCGRRFEKKGLNKFKSHYTMGLAGKEAYCSTKCKNEAEAAQGGSSSSSGASSSDSAENNAELARLEWEKEQAVKQEAAEKKAKREAKAKVLREQDKPFMAFVVVNQFIIFIGVYALLMGVPLAFAMGGTVVGIIVSIIIGGVLGFGIYKYLKELFKKQIFRAGNRQP